MRKVRIKLAKAQMGGSYPGTPGSTGPVLAPDKYTSGKKDTDGVKVNTTLKPAEREYSNLEAELGETVLTNLTEDGIPEFYKISGKRHSKGGTPLNLPKDSFIFSRDKKLKIKDKDILSQFGKRVGKKGKKAFLPSEISKQYDINKYRQILADPTSDKIQIETAEKMIQNYTLKLGGLAMVQESMKGFPKGIPAAAMPYLEHIGINPEELMQPPVQQSPSRETMKFGGASGKRRVRVSGLPKYQNGSEVSSTTKETTKYQNIPKGSVKWDVGAEGYDESQVKKGDYVLENGSWSKYTGDKSVKSKYEGTPVEELNPKLGQSAEAYGRLEYKINNSPDVQAQLIKNYRKKMSNMKAQGKLTDSDIEEMTNMEDDQIIKNYLRGAEQNMIINEYQGNFTEEQGRTGGYDTGWNKELNMPNKYAQLTSEIGIEPMSAAETGAFQTSYLAMSELSKSDKFKDEMKGFSMTQVGIGDEAYDGVAGAGKITKIDGWAGDTTLGQNQLAIDDAQEKQYEDVPWEDLPKEEKIKHLDNINPQDPNAPWWLQDVVKVAGAAKDYMGIKKRDPWQATPGVYVPDPVFMDPTRQLAANAEMANIGTQGAGVFAGPQAFNARYSQIQGQAAQNVANTLAGVNGQNVNIANQFEGQRAQIMNQASANKAQLATQLYDKNVISNQQFDNAKNQARQQMRQGYIDGITNRAQAQTMNQLYPQYNVDPSSGGFMNFTQGREITPTNGNNSGVNDKFAEYKRLNPGVSDDVIYKMASADMGLQPQNPNSMNASQFAYRG